MKTNTLHRYLACDWASITKAWIRETVITAIHLDTFSADYALALVDKDETATKDEINKLTKLIILHIESYAQSDEMIQYFNELMLAN